MSTSALTHAMSRRPVSAGNCGNAHCWMQTPPCVTDAHCGSSAQPCAHLVRLICSTYLGASGDGCVGHSGGGGARLAAAELEAIESMALRRASRSGPAMDVVFTAGWHGTLAVIGHACTSIAHVTSANDIFLRMVQARASATAVGKVWVWSKAAWPWERQRRRNCKIGKCKVGQLEYTVDVGF